MKLFIQTIFTITAGISLVFGLSSYVIGVDETIGSVKVAYGHYFDDTLVSETTIGAYATSATGDVLGLSHNAYSRLIIEDIDEIVAELEPAPFIVPSSGIAGHKNFLFIPGGHPGIDIWTNNDGGGGTDGDRHKGNPVYAACSGLVTRVYGPNEEIEIICDSIDESYKDIVPSLKVKILYSHMGSAVTHETFHNLYVGKRVEQGEFVGYQGNVSSFVPENRVVHLHFGVYDLSRPGRPVVSPSTYIGIPTDVVGQLFVANP